MNFIVWFHFQTGYKCVCNCGYCGKKCDKPTVINPCQFVRCLNSGTCEKQGGEAICRCTSSWFGPRCELPRPSSMFKFPYFLTFHMARRCLVSVIARIKFLPEKTCKLIELHHLYSFDWLFSHFLTCFIHILLSLRSNTLQHSIHSMFYK